MHTNTDERIKTDIYTIESFDARNTVHVFHGENVMILYQTQITVLLMDSSFLKRNTTGTRMQIRVRVC